MTVSITCLNRQAPATGASTFLACVRIARRWRRKPFGYPAVVTPRLALAMVIVSLTMASTASARSVAFRTPSGNIGCVGETAGAGNMVRCDIRARTWSPPPKPGSCRLDWGQGLSLSRLGRSRYVCAGDTALNTGPKLAYGASVRVGAITCVSRTSGLTCTNAAKHGFAMSRERLRRF